MKIEDCGKKRVLYPIRDKCIKVNRNKPNSKGVKIAEYLDNALEQWQNSQPVKKWKKKPGSKGFNKYALKQMRRNGLSKKLSLKCNGKSFAYQETVSFCLHPSTTIDRLLVIHRTGSGKTRTMIKVLENYFFDLRPKIIIFPTQETTNNFYLQLMSFDNMYSHIVKDKYPNIMSRLNNSKMYSKALSDIKDFLAMKGELGKFKKGLMKRGPMRAYRYSVAGGESIFKGPRPNDPMFKLNFETRGKEYSNKIVLMDEVHNLVTPSLELSKYQNKLNKLKNAIYDSKNTVLGGFTATPIVRGMEKAKELLKVVKGTTKGNNEGYISYFNELPRAIYPSIKVTKMYIPILKRSYDRKNMKKSFKPGSNYEAYARAYKHRPKDVTGHKAEAQILKLCNYINMGVYYTRVKHWSKDFKRDPERWGSKLYHVIKDIEKHKKKSLILIHRRAGYRGLVEAFKLISIAKMFPKCKFCFASAYNKNDSKFIKEFSKKNNMKGGKIKIFIADSSQFSEGVSFLGVRKLYLFNPSLTYSQYLQLRGRAIRACASHTSLPKKERNVEIINCIGELDGLRSVDNFLMDKIESEESRYKKEMGFFKKQAVDFKILRKFFKKSNRANR